MFYLLLGVVGVLVLGVLLLVLGLCRAAGRAFGEDEDVGGRT